jgi:hypothetical protein
LNQRDEDLLANQEVDKRNIKQKVMNFLKKRFPKKGGEAITMLSKGTEFDFSEDNDNQQLHLYDFMEIFVDINQIITCQEAMILFDEINKTPKEAKKEERPKINSTKIYEYFQEDAVVTKEKSKKLVISDQKAADQNNDKFSDEEDEEDVKAEVISDKKAKNAKTGIQIHQVEKDSKIMLPSIYTFFKKSAVKKEENILENLKKLYGKRPAKLNVDQLKEINAIIFNGQTELKFKDLYEVITKLTSYKNDDSNTYEELRKHFTNAIDTDSNADIKETPNKDKGFVNVILSLPDNKSKPCSKYNYLGEYYRNDNKFKEWAIKYKGKSKESEEDEKENKENEKPSAGGMGIFGKLGGGGNKDDEEDEINGMGADLVAKLKSTMEQDFAAFRNEMSTGITGGVGGLGKKIKISKEESDRFNKVLSEFLKNFKEISSSKNITSNVESVTNFFYKHNGSSKIAELRKKIKFQNIDILDLWKEVDTWDKLDFKKNIMSKYVF